MAKERTCIKCSSTCLPKQTLCSEHFAEYMRDYRPQVRLAREKENHAKGFRDGVTACCDYLRQHVGGHAVAGFQLARDLEKAHIGAETGEQIQRKALLVSLKGL